MAITAFLGLQNGTSLKPKKKKKSNFTYNKITPNNSELEHNELLNQKVQHMCSRVPKRFN